ncbi:MAG: lytic transglycosylase domain-containing protein [Gammaproteobacteria bacterium]|nr:lytic transglycosylase domain-containing protein [Gammaproteobacteria bacterium]
MKTSIVLLTAGILALAGAEGNARLETTLPRETVMALVAREADEQGVPADLALAVAETESNFATLAISSKGARGVMQIMPRTARNLYGLKPYQLFDARTNIRAGLAYLRSLIDRYGREDIALSHYNGGSGVRRPDGRYAVIPATRRYVDRVLSRRRHYAGALMGRHGSLQPEGIPPFGWRAAASRELGTLDKERRQTVEALRALVLKNTRRWARHTGADIRSGRARVSSGGPASIHYPADGGRRQPPGSRASTGHR